MRTLLTRYLMFGVLIGWALSHATVFAQQAGKTASAADKVRAALDKTISVDYSGQSLTDAINHLRDRTGIAINVDNASLTMMGMNPDINNGGQQFLVKAANEKVSKILRKLLGAYGLSYVLFEDSVLVTSEEMAVLRQMTQRVSVDLEEVPLKKAVRELAKKHGLNLVIDPKVLTQSETPVTLQVDDTGIETAIRLLAEMAELKAVRMGNVMFVTNEEKAKKIRDEEKHQFDNSAEPESAGRRRSLLVCRLRCVPRRLF